MVSIFWLRNFPAALKRERPCNHKQRQGTLDRTPVVHCVDMVLILSFEKGRILCVSRRRVAFASCGTNPIELKERICSQILKVGIWVRTPKLRIGGGVALGD